MPAGGTWKVQNKQRPGAYINFVSVSQPVGSIGERGIITCALPMTWGPAKELIAVYGEDLLNGKSIAKIGCSAFDVEESLPYRLALTGCYRALLYRLDTGGQAATATISNALTVNAKYAGTTGNSISVVIKSTPNLVGEWTVDVLFKSVKRESFVITGLSELNDVESEWVEFVVTEGDVPTTSGTTLEGGTNGTVGKDLSDYFNLVGGESWQCMAINTSDYSINSSVVEFIKLMRENRGRKCQAVIHDASDVDYEGIISVTQGYKTAVDTVSEDLFPVFVASITAGADVNESNTARVIDGAVSIINPVAEEEIEDHLRKGEFILTYRQDGAVCVEKDINSLHTFTPDKGYAFSKNRVVRCLDEIGNTTALVFNTNYCGKVDNNEAGRNAYKTELISMMDELVSIGAIQNFEGAEDITVLPGNEIDSVVVDVVVQPVDSMEKLYMTVNVDA